MLKVWGRCSAFNVQKVMWVVAELGLPHDRIDIGGAFGGLDDPAFLAINPHGRIPVIDDAGLVVWESHAIIRYLCARYGSGTLWPPDAAERSFADRWMDWSATTLQRDFMDLFWGYYRTPDDERDWPRLRELIERCARHYRLLDAQLAQRPYLGGRRARGHDALSLLGARSRAPAHSLCRSLVSTAGGAARLSRARHGAVRRASRTAGFLKGSVNRRVGKGGPGASIFALHPIRRAHVCEASGHGGPNASPM